MQIKTKIRSYYIPTGIVTVKKLDYTKCWWGCGTTRSLIDMWWECKWYSHFGNKLGSFLNSHLPNDQVIPLLYIYPRDMKTHVHTKTCTWMSIGALFIITKN